MFFEPSASAMDWVAAVQRFARGSLAARDFVIGAITLIVVVAWAIAVWIVPFPLRYLTGALLIVLGVPPFLLTGYLLLHALAYDARAWITRRLGAYKKDASFYSR